MCLARKAPAAGGAIGSGLDKPPNEPAKVTLASNLQNWTMLAFAPKVPQVLGVVVQVLCDLFTPRRAGWLPAALQQLKSPLATLQHAEWEEPRFFVVFSYYGPHALLPGATRVAGGARDGSLRQLSTADEFAALTAVAGGALAAIRARYASRFTSPAQAPLLPSDLPPEQEAE